MTSASKRTERVFGECLESLSALLAVLRSPGGREELPVDPPNGEHLLRDLRGLLRDVRLALEASIGEASPGGPRRRALVTRWHHWWAARWSRRPRDKALRTWRLKGRRRSASNGQGEESCRRRLCEASADFTPADRPLLTDAVEFSVLSPEPLLDVVIPVSPAEQAIVSQGGEQWCCESTGDEEAASGISAPWRSAPGLPTPQLTLRSDGDFSPEKIQKAECEVVESPEQVQLRQAAILRLRHQLYAISDRSRHLPGVPGPEAPRTTRSPGPHLYSRPGTFRELFSCEQATLSTNACGVSEVVVQDRRMSRPPAGAVPAMLPAQPPAQAVAPVVLADIPLAQVPAPAPPRPEPKYDGDDVKADELYVAVKGKDGQVTWRPKLAT